MSESLFGLWKRSFPILKSVRTDHNLSQKIVASIAILQNIARLWDDETPENDEDDQDGDSAADSDDESQEGVDDFTVQDAVPATIRLRGKVMRDRLRDRY